MRATISAKILADGLRFAGKAVPNRTVIPIVGDIKIEARATALVLTGTDLDHEHTAVLDVEEAEAGAVAVPTARLTELVSKLPAASAVTLKQEADHCLVTCGKGRWRLPVLDPADFPVLTGPGEQAAQFTLPAAEAKRLVARLSYAISNEQARAYLNGIHLQQQAGQLVAQSTNGHILARIVIALDRGDGGYRDEVRESGDEAIRAYISGGHDLIIPTAVVAVLGDLAAAGDIAIAVDSKKISLRCGTWSATSKLIDGKFPDTARVIPKASQNHVEVAAADLLNSIERHVAASEGDTSIGLTWGDGKLTTCLARSEDGASEELEARTAGAGRVSLSARYLIDTLKALAGKFVTIDHDGGGSPVRFTTADEPASLAIIMPLAWFEPAVDAQPQPPARTRRGK